MPLLLKLAVLSAAILCTTGIVLAVVAVLHSDAGQKARRTLRAYLLIGVGLSLGALTLILFQFTRPILHIDGTIDAAQVIKLGKGHRTYLRVRSANGAAVVLNASESDPHFRTGEHILANYRGDTGFILNASFRAPDGREQARFRGSDSVPPYFGLFAGGFFFWMGIRRNQREPVAA